MQLEWIQICLPVCLPLPPLEVLGFASQYNSHTIVKVQEVQVRSTGDVALSSIWTSTLVKLEIIPENPESLARLLLSTPPCDGYISGPLGAVSCQFAVSTSIIPFQASCLPPFISLSLQLSFLHLKHSLRLRSYLWLASPGAPPPNPLTPPPFHPPPPPHLILVFMSASHCGTFLGRGRALLVVFVSAM